MFNALSYSVTKFLAMHKPRHQRRNAKHRKVQSPPKGTNLPQVAKISQYVGSPYHKHAPSFAGPAIALRPGATLCPRSLIKNKALITKWLRDAIRKGHTGTYENGFPKYVWYRHGATIYEARQGSPGSGEYHGYPLWPQQTVRGLP